MFPLQSIEVRNFRGIENLDIPLDPRATVFFGRNAAGKTTIIDALCIGLGAIGERMPNSTGRDFSPDDLRRYLQRQETLFGPSQSEERVSEIASVVLRGSDDVTWGMIRRRDQAVGYPRGFVGRKLLHDWLDPRITAIQEKRADASVLLPVFAAYGPERAVMEIPLRERDFGKEFPRLAGLADALKATTRFKAVFEWFRVMEDEERRAREEHRDWDYRLPALEWVRRATMNALPNCKNPRIVTRPLRMVVDFVREEGQVQALDIRAMSDGYRTHFALVADLARRMVQVNPSDDLGSETHGTRAKAVVLIDEIDLHLHPTWQATVLPGLLRAFPNTQFIVTTHSEQVISSVHRNQVYALDTREGRIEISAVPFAQGATGDRILTELMGVEDRVPGEVTTRLRRYLRLVEGGQGDSEEAVGLRSQLDEDLPGEPILVQADLERERQTLMARFRGRR